MPDDQNVAVPSPAPASVPASPETFSREYVSELRNENKTYRLKAQEAEKKALEAEERAKKADEEAGQKTTAAERAANDRILRAELKAAALKAGMIDLDGLKLADMSQVKLNEAGEVEGAEALMAAMKEAKPYLFQTAATTTQTHTKPEKKDPAPVDVKSMSKEEYAAHKRALGIR